MGIETAVWRALAVFRVLGLAYAVAVYLRRYDEYAHPVSGWLVLVAMAAWTLVVIRFFALRQRRPLVLAVLAIDLTLAAAAILASRWLDDPSRIAAGAQTLPVVWASAPVLAWAIWGGWRAGLAAALVVSAADIAHRGAVTVATANNIVLLLLAGAVIGYTVDLARRGESALARALAVEAASRERERLSRTIHDGVLQVLAMVGRRGQEAGGEAAELGRLAADQERALRSLVSGSGNPYAESEGLSGQADLCALLAAYASSSVTVSTPATAILLGQSDAIEVAAAVAAALANVENHAGPTSRAWVLLEQEGSDVVVTIRDDGQGFAPGRLDEAITQGRLGVASSISGRVRDLGGTTSIESSPGLGTEVELRIPLLHGTRPGVSAQAGSPRRTAERPTGRSRT